MKKRNNITGNSIGEHGRNSGNSNSKHADGSGNSNREHGRDSGKTVVFRRSMFYAICLFVMYQLMLIPLQVRNFAVFWTAAVLGLFLIMAELLYSRISEMHTKIHIDLPHYRTIRWREHVLHHAVIPALLYVSGVLFLFFNRVRTLDQVAIVILSGTFFVILYNVSATYLKMYQVSRHTRTLFDFVNIIVFYFVTDVLINLMLYSGLSQSWLFIGTAVLTGVLIGLMIMVTRQSSVEMALMLVLTALLMGVIVYVLWQVPMFNIAVISIVATVAFYLFDVYWHHQLEGSFSWDVMSQYILFAVMAVILLLYI